MLEYLLHLLLWVVALMTGFLSILRELLSIYRPKQGPRSLFWNCIIIAFVISASILWFIEHQKITDLTNELKESKEHNKPNFALSINQTIIGQSPNLNETFLLINLGIKNIGSPSVAIGWFLSVKSPSVTVDKKTPSFIQDGYEIKDRQGRKVIARFHQNNRIEEKTMTPIQRGAYIGGWLLFKFPEIAPERIREAVITLYVKDIFEKEYSVIFKPEAGQESPPGSIYFSGSGDNPFLSIPKKP